MDLVNEQYNEGTKYHKIISKFKRQKLQNTNGWIIITRWCKYAFIEWTKQNSSSVLSKSPNHYCKKMSKFTSENHKAF